jgi:hypothetical protein
MRALARAVDTQTCQSVGTPSIGLDESAAPPLPEGRLICATSPTWPEQDAF